MRQMGPIMLFLRQNFRRIAFSSGLIFLLLVCIGGLWLLMQDRRGLLAAEPKIKSGMGLPEVEAIVGARPTFHTHAPQFAEWISNNDELFVKFDENGKVITARGYHRRGSRPPFLVRLKSQIRKYLHW